MIFTQSFVEIHKFFQTRSIWSRMMKRDPPISLQQPQLLNVTLVINGRVDESTSPRMHFYVLSGLPVEVLNYPREAIPRHEIVQNRNRPTHYNLAYTRKKRICPVWCLGSTGITHAINPSWNDDGRRWSLCLINRRARLFSGITML